MVLQLSFGSKSACFRRYIFFLAEWTFVRASRPSDFSYKHEAKHSSMFMTVGAWDDTDDDMLMQELSEVLKGVKSCL
jgi:hypothetical protein